MRQKQIKFLEAMLEECNVKRAAEKAKISRNTAYKYLNDPEFTKELQARQNDLVGETVAFLQSKLHLCNTELVKIVEDHDINAQVRINAIKTLYSACKELTDTAVIMERMKNIEVALEEREEEWQ